MSGQPRGDCCRLAIGQQVDNAAPFQIANDGAVAMTALPCPVVDAYHAGRHGIRDGMAANHT